jgi:hypothetical protein
MPFTLDPFLPFIAVGNGTGVEVAGEGRLDGRIGHGSIAFLSLVFGSAPHM